MKTYVLEKTEKLDSYSYFQLTDIESYFNIAHCSGLQNQGRIER